MTAVIAVQPAAVQENKATPSLNDTLLSLSDGALSRAIEILKRPINTAIIGFNDENSPERQRVVVERQCMLNCLNTESTARAAAKLMLRR